MEGPRALSHEVYAYIYIYIYILTVNMAKIEMGIFPTCQNHILFLRKCQNHLNCRKKLLLLNIVLDIVFNPCDSRDFINANLYVMYLV